MYLHEHLKPMSTPAVAQLVSTMLYHKRFFPYYVSNIVAGLDQDGKGTLYSYDPVGHCEKNRYFSFLLFNLKDNGQCILCVCVCL
jgi:20S proteasome subunit beta 6